MGIYEGIFLELKNVGDDELLNGPLFVCGGLFDGDDVTRCGRWGECFN